MAASNLKFSNQNRVFTKGEDVNGGEIGTYSTKDTLVGASSFVKKSSVNKVFGVRGLHSIKTHKRVKTGIKSDWVTLGAMSNISTHKTSNAKHLKVLKGGYKEIRNIEGFPNDKVYLIRTRKMFRDLSFQKVGDSWCIGFPANYNDKLTYADMIANFREKYGKKIFGISASDQKNIDMVLQRYLSQLIKK